MSGNTCSFDGCGRRVRARGLCDTHNQQRRRGVPLTSIRAKAADASVRNDDGDKWCSTGEHWTPPDVFSRNPKASDGLRSVCNRCTKLARFQMKLADYEAKLAAQGGVCAYCLRPEPNGQPLVVDHDHQCCPQPGESCGRCVRDLLCSRCNLGAGQFGDDVEALLRAAAALTRHHARLRS